MNWIWGVADRGGQEWCQGFWLSSWKEGVADMEDCVRAGLGGISLGRRGYALITKNSKSHIGLFLAHGTCRSVRRSLPSLRKPGGWRPMSWRYTIWMEQRMFSVATATEREKLENHNGAFHCPGWKWYTALLLTLNWPEQVIWPYHVLSFMCPEGEENWILVNICNVSHMGKDQEFVFLLC